MPDFKSLQELALFFPYGHITESTERQIRFGCVCCKTHVPNIKINMMRPWHVSFASYNRASSFRF